MNSIKHLTNLCRICFGEGEYSLEYKVKLPAFENIFRQSSGDESFDLDIQINEDELTVHEMLIAFSKSQGSELFGSDTIQLICHPCLNELISCLMFAQKVEFANKKIIKLISPDFEMEKDLEGEQTIEYLEETQDDFFLENDKFFSEEPEHLSEIDETKMPDDENEHSNVSQDDTTTLFEVERATSPMLIAQKRKSALVSAVDETTKMLPKINRQSDITHATKPILRKRLKTEREKKHRQYSIAPLEQGSLVVTQFIPSKTQVHLETAYTNEDQLNDELATDFIPPSNELRTMDYAAVEIQCSSEVQVNESDNYISSSENGENQNATDTAGGGDPSNSEPIYVCKYCPQAFSAAHFLITHARKSHVCKFCTQAFCLSSNLYEHIRSAHTEHRCAICGKEFSTHSNLRSHIKRVHGVKLPAQVALLDYRRRISVLSENNETLQDKQDLEVNFSDSFDVAENDMLVPSQEQPRKVKFKNDANFMQKIAASIDVTEVEQIKNY